MATGKNDVKHGTAQAKSSEDDMLRVAYKHGTPLEGGKIAESEPVNFFSSAHNIQGTDVGTDESSFGPQSRPHRPRPDDEDGGRGMANPENKTPSMAPQP